MELALVKRRHTSIADPVTQDASPSAYDPVPAPTATTGGADTSVETGRVGTALAIAGSLSTVVVSMAPACYDGATEGVTISLALPVSAPNVSPASTVVSEVPGQLAGVLEGVFVIQALPASGPNGSPASAAEGEAPGQSVGVSEEVSVIQALPASGPAQSWSRAGSCNCRLGRSVGSVPHLHRSNRGRVVLLRRPPAAAYCNHWQGYCRADTLPCSSCCRVG